MCISNCSTRLRVWPIFSPNIVSRYIFMQNNETAFKNNSFIQTGNISRHLMDREFRSRRKSIFCKGVPEPWGTNGTSEFKLGRLMLRSKIKNYLWSCILVSESQSFSVPPPTIPWQDLFQTSFDNFCLGLFLFGPCINNSFSTACFNTLLELPVLLECKRTYTGIYNGFTNAINVFKLLHAV